MKSKEDKMEELTRYAFMSHMEDYIKNLLRDPLHADTDNLLKDYGIDGPVALKMLLKKTNPEDEMSSVIIRTEKIKDNGTDENGKRNKDTFEISYKIPRKDFKKKLRNLYINLFECNIIDTPVLNEGAWGYGILDSDSALDFQSEFASVCLKTLLSKVRFATDSQNLWGHLGVLIDFLKKYKDDEIQLTDEYNDAIEITKNLLFNLLHDENFINNWDEPKKITSSIKSILKDVALLKYQKDIMNPRQQQITPSTPAINPAPLLEDGEGGCMGGIAGATSDSEASNGQYTTPLFGKPIKRKTLYITQEQSNYLKEATATTNAGDYEYTVPLGNKNNDFYKEACDHEDIMKKSFKNNE